MTYKNMLSSFLQIDISNIPPVYVIGVASILILLILIISMVSTQKKNTIQEDVKVVGKKSQPVSVQRGYSTSLGDVNYIKELMLTFSNKKSLLSSKKIERFITFIAFLTITIIYLVKKIDDITTVEFLEVLGVWLGYGGYNSFMNYKDKKIQDAPGDEPPIN